MYAFLLVIHCSFRFFIYAYLFFQVLPVVKEYTEQGIMSKYGYQDYKAFSISIDYMQKEVLLLSLFLKIHEKTGFLIMRKQRRRSASR